jgi:hypothetical protein
MQFYNFSGFLNIHVVLGKLCYGEIIQVFGEFKLLGFHLSAISGNFAAQGF